MGVCEPARGFAVRHAGAETFGHDGGSAFSTRFEAGNGILGAGKRRQQRIIIIGLGSRLAPAGRAGRFEQIRITLGFPGWPPQIIFLVFWWVSGHFAENLQVIERAEIMGSF